MGKGDKKALEGKYSGNEGTDYSWSSLFTDPEHADVES